MRRPSARLGASRVLLTAALTALGCIQHRSSVSRPTLPGIARPAVPGARGKTVQFTDVTRQAGLRFRHTNGGFGQKYLPETMGSGCAFFDFDGDGWLDLLLLNDRPLSETGRQRDGGTRRADVRTLPVPPSRRPPVSALYRNNRDGTFTDVTRGSGLDVPMYAMGCCVGDYDNDGRDDLFITTCLEPNHLFHNEGGGKFREVTVNAGVGDRRWGTSCAWVDYDRDGWLDLFVCNYLRFRSLKDDKFCSLVANRKSYCPPGAYAGESCILYRNNRDGTFSDVSRQTGVGQQTGNSLGVAILDFDDDGWPDIAVANDETPNYLFHNVGAQAGTRAAGDGDRLQSGSPSTTDSPRRFEETGMESGLAVAETGKPKAGMGVDAADYRNDGSLGILISNFSNEGLSFYRRDGDLLSEVSFATGFGGPSLLTLGFGLFFFDLDNDGRKDAFIANGHVNDDIQLVQSNLAYRQRPQLFRNRGDGRFEEVGREAGAPFSHEDVGRGAAYGDYDRDGDLDILVSNNNGEAELLRNEGRPAEPGEGAEAQVGNWLQVEVKGRGPAVGARGTDVAPRSLGGTNRSGIGARVRVKAGSVVQTDWVRSGSSYLSQSMLWRHFGLGQAKRADWVEVTWTNGRRQRMENVSANQRVLIEERE